MRINHSMIEQQMLQMLRNSQNQSTPTQQTRPRVLQDTVSFTQLLNESADVVKKADAPGDQDKRKSQNRRPAEPAEESANSSEETKASGPECSTAPNHINFTA